MPEKIPRHMRIRQTVRDDEAFRITLIHCLDMLKTLHEKQPNALSESNDPHGITRSWLKTAEKNLGMLLQAIVEHEI